MSIVRDLATIARSGIATVDTVADLRALNMEIYPDTVQTLGAIQKAMVVAEPGFGIQTAARSIT